MSCNGLRENPEQFQSIILNAIEKMTASMSGDCDTMFLNKEPESDAVLGHVQALQLLFEKSMNELITNMWNELEISHKASIIYQLESTYPPDFKAWRPTTGEIPIANLKGHSLADTKERLLYKIKKCEVASEELKNTLYVKATAVRKSLKKIHKSQESLMNLCNDYEKVVRNDS